MLTFPKPEYATVSPQWSVNLRVKSALISQEWLFRSCTTPALHIGYVVVPEFRRQSHATTMLRMAPQIAHHKLGLGRVLVTCDDDNIGSIRTIENNGDILENVVSGPDLDKPKRRYWIHVTR